MTESNTDADRRQWVADGIRAHALWLHRQRVADIVQDYGSVEEWRDHHAPKISADRDLKLARIIVGMMTDAPGRPRGTIRWQAHRDLLLADRPLAAYVASVAQADAWEEERARLAACKRHAAASLKLRERIVVASDSYVMKTMLQTMRLWGQALLDGGMVPDPYGLFVPPKP